MTCAHCHQYGMNFCPVHRPRPRPLGVALLLVFVVGCASAAEPLDGSLEVDAEQLDAGELGADQGGECLPTSTSCSGAGCCTGLCGPAELGSSARACLEPCAGSVCPAGHTCQSLEVGSALRAACVPLPEA